MIRALVRKLGLDRVGQVLTEEVRRVHIKVLQEEREVLAKLLAQLDDRIRGLGGKRRGRPPGPSRSEAKMAAPRTRRKLIVRKPGETLRLFVLRAFRKWNRGALTVKGLVKRVQQLGYQTAGSPQNLLLRLYRVLSDKKLYKKVGTGLYALALPSPTSGKIGKRNRRTKPATKPATMGLKTATRTGTRPVMPATRQAKPQRRTKTAAAAAK